MGFRNPFITEGVLVHTIAFWFRTASFVASYLWNDDEAETLHPLEMHLIDDWNYILQLNSFLLYLVLGSVLNQNILKYYIAIFWMFHNSILSLRILLHEMFSFGFGNWFFLVTLFISYLAEAFIAVIYSNRMLRENNYELFKKIGLNPAINKAHSIRKSLEAFDEVNMYMAIAMVAKVMLLPKSCLEFFAIIVGIFFAITVLQQLFTCINKAGEHRLQRKIAIMLCFIKIPLTVILMIKSPKISLYHEKEKKMVVDKFFEFIAVDLLLISLCSGYFLIQDYRNFGSGLEEYFQLKTKRITLNTKYRMS